MNDNFTYNMAAFFIGLFVGWIVFIISIYLISKSNNPIPQSTHSYRKNNNEFLVPN